MPSSSEPGSFLRPGLLRKLPRDLARARASDGLHSGMVSVLGLGAKSKRRVV